MIFNTNTALNVEMKDVKYIDADIHENVAPAGARFDKSPNGNNFIEFKFEKNGAMLTHTEYEPNKYPDQTDNEFQDKIDVQIKRIMQIMKVFYTKEQLSYVANSFTDFGNWVATLMNNVDKTKLVRLKVVYGNSGFTTLPRYSKYTFIEPMTIDAKDSKISKLKIDIFERPEMGDSEPEVKSSLATFSEPSVGKSVSLDETPF